MTTIRSTAASIKPPARIGPPTGKKPAPAAPPLAGPIAKLAAIRDWANARVIGRTKEINLLTLALASKSNVLLLGVPGTAKTMMVDLMSRAFCPSPDDFFDILMTKFSKPAEVFGPTDVIALRDEAKMRVAMEGFLPEAKVGFLDEALHVDTPIATPGGWERMGDLKPGDEVFGTSGAPVKITAVTPIVEGHPCYRVGLIDGEEIIADAGHKWMVRAANSNPNSPYRIMTTAEMAATGRKYNIELPKPVELPETSLPIDPYVLGLWLGNGNNWTGEIYTRRVWVVATLAAVRRVYPEAYVGRDLPGMKALSMGGTGFRTQLREQGLIQNKRVPEVYLRGSLAQRHALLQGLMDTDGYMGKEGTCVFSNTNEGVVDAVIQIVRSFGIRATKCLTKDSRIGANGPHRPCWKVTFRGDPMFAPFAARGIAPPPRTHAKRHLIVSIKKCKSVPVRCITVDADNHLFLAGLSMVPTSNCFKASSAILNALLRIANERKFRNGSTWIDCPTRMIVGASNEFPEDPATLAAFYDRFPLKMMVDSLDDTTFTDMLRLVRDRPTPGKPPVTMTDADFAELDRLVSAVVVPEGLIEVLSELRGVLRAKGIRPSDRRWSQCIRIIRASAALAGRTTAARADLQAIEPVMWSTHEEIGQVRSEIVNFLNPIERVLREAIDAAWAGRRMILDAAGSANDAVAAASAATKALSQINQQEALLQVVESKMVETDSDREQLAVASSAIARLKDAVGAVCIGKADAIAKVRELDAPTVG